MDFPIREKKDVAGAHVSLSGRDGPSHEILNVNHAYISFPVSNAQVESAFYQAKNRQDVSITRAVDGWRPDHHHWNSIRV
jgi:hypothetical protein